MGLLTWCSDVYAVFGSLVSVDGADAKRELVLDVPTGPVDVVLVGRGTSGVCDISAVRHVPALSLLLPMILIDLYQRRCR